MAEKLRRQAEVLENRQIGTGIFSLLLDAGKIAVKAEPGQFVSVYSNDASRLLPRPISICEADPEDGVLRLVFRVAGKGTEEFSRLTRGDRVWLTGPLGNGFPLDRAAGGRTVFLIGGGIGIPPLVQLARRISETSPDSRIVSVLGFRDEQFLVEELSEFGPAVIATEDGSAGTKGNVLDAIRQKNLSADLIFACGPTPMLRALKKYAEESKTECWLSLEEKMACGIGACLSCVCASVETDGHSKVHNKRVCSEGPVFLSTEVEL